MLARQSRTSLSVLSRWVRLNSTQVTPNPSPTEPTPSTNQSNEPPVVLTEPDIASMVIHGRSLYPPTQLPRPYNIPAAELHFRSHHHYPLDLFAHFASHAASALGIPATRPIPLPTKRSLWTVLRGPFVHKKSQENFERRVHKRVIKAWDADPEVVERWIRYVRHHQMPGVGIRVTRWERAPLGIGKQIFEHAMQKIRPDPADIQNLADKIVKEEMSSAAEGESSTKASPKEKQKQS